MPAVVHKQHLLQYVCRVEGCEDLLFCLHMLLLACRTSLLAALHQRHYLVELSALS